MADLVFESLGVFHLGLQFGGKNLPQWGKNIDFLVGVGDKTSLKIKFHHKLQFLAQAKEIQRCSNMIRYSKCYQMFILENSTFYFKLGANIYGGRDTFFGGGGGYTQ